MLKYASDQADRLISGMVGATLGVVLTFSRTSLGGALAFLTCFVFLFCFQGIPRYFTRQPNGMRHAFVLYLIFLAIWTISLFYFSNLLFFREGWKATDIDVSIFVLLIAFLFGSLISILCSVFDGRPLGGTNE